jgi:hypothetical protein
MHFRLILQPAMAALFAIRDGIRDARSGEPAYFWSLFTEPGNRRYRMRSGWKAVGRVFALAMVMDIIYQVIAFHLVHPGEAFVVAAGLAILPYLLLRGPTSRVIRHCACRKKTSQQMN